MKRKKNDKRSGNEYVPTKEEKKKVLELIKEMKNEKENKSIVQPQTGNDSTCEDNR